MEGASKKLPQNPCHPGRMPPTSSRIAEDLRGQIVGEVLSDDLTRRLYATDASLYEILPLTVVRPRRTADVVATVRYAAQEGLPIHARGAGSGLVGGCLGEGIVVDFSRFMRRLIEDRGDTVRAQAGLVHGELNRRLAASDRVFAPDPETSDSTTLGGVAAVDASGPRWPVYGSASDHVASVTAVLSDGAVVKFDQEGVVSESADRSDSPHSRPATLARSVADLLRLQQGVIREQTPRGCVNTSGYPLDQVLQGDRVDLRRLMLGSEGTLGLITELELLTTPKPRCVGAALLIFPSLERAAHAAQAVAPLGIAACDLLDRRCVGLAREIDPRYDVLLSGAAEAVLYVEVFADYDDQLHERLEAIDSAVRRDENLAAETFLSETAEDYALFSRLSREQLATLHGLKGNRRAAPGVEDIAVPPAALPQLFHRLQETLKRRQITASVYSHAAHGRVHVRPLLDFTRAPELRKLETLAGDLYDTVWLLGGTMSGSHGDGLSRTPFTSRQHGPLVNVFREVKRLFDPQGLLNPGKIVPSPGVRMTHSPRKVIPADPPRRESAAEDAEDPGELVQLQLGWSLDQANEAARDCNGCGACRSRGPDSRMCPIFRYSPREEASPRAKANLMRAITTGELDPDVLLRDETKRVADLCVNCHMCRVDCPAEVDIPRLMLEAKAEYVKTNGLTWDLWWTTRIDAIAKWLSASPRLSNRLFAVPQFRWLVERVTGLAAARRLPRLATRPFQRRAMLKGFSRPKKSLGDKVVYFVDTYANHFDTDVAKALEHILDRHQIGLYVPTRQMHSGMPQISQGLLTEARRIAEHNVQLLAEAVRQGYDVVATEPAAVLALTHEYPILLPDDEDAQLVADHTFEACQYLWRRHLNARLQLDLRPMPYRVALHVPCHLRALGVGVPSENLLRLIPGMRATRVDKGCSGMAGTFGMLRRNYRASLRAGLPLLTELRTGQYLVGATECGACRTQMEQGSRMPTYHPLKLLAASYGLMPEVADELESLNAPDSSD